MIVRKRTGLEQPLLALTFDDGPSDWTERVLDLLREHEARATFFVIGESVAGREGTLRRTKGEGHQLGSHTFSHLHPATLDDDEVREELRRGAEAVGSGAKLVRPPYGEDAVRFDRLARELGLGPTVLWSVDPRDWEAERDVIVERVLAGVEPGAIVDLHDGRRAREGAIEALEIVLSALTARGLASVTVSELLRASPRPPG